MAQQQGDDAKRVAAATDRLGRRVELDPSGRVRVDHPAAPAVRVALLAGAVLSALTLLLGDRDVATGVALVLMALAAAVAAVAAATWLVGRVAHGRRGVLEPPTRAGRAAGVLWWVAFGIFHTGGVIIVVVVVVGLVTTRPWSG